MPPRRARRHRHERVERVDEIARHRRRVRDQADALPGQRTTKGGVREQAIDPEPHASAPGTFQRSAKDRERLVVMEVRLADRMA
jgi:hypothetical protein